MKAKFGGVLIVGSGAAGSAAAHELTRQGVPCVLLEAGPVLDFSRHVSARATYDLQYRGFGAPRLPRRCNGNEFDQNVWANERDNPYIEQHPFNWVRMRVAGGRTLMWGRYTWRMSDYEFRCQDHDGFGENWPLWYRDIAPYYDRLERLFGVVGRSEGLAHVPDGCFEEDHSPFCESIRRFAATAARQGIVVTKPRQVRRQFLSSLDAFLTPALKTGLLTVVADAVVSHITTDRTTGLANGVCFFDRGTGVEYHTSARVVVLAASALESTRILLNSGLGNSSGVLGRYLTDHISMNEAVVCVVPDKLADSPAASLVAGNAYVPRFRNVHDCAKEFLRGYSFTISSGRPLDPKYIPGYGRRLIRELDATERAAFCVSVITLEVLPRFDNYVELDPNEKDAWGIPVLRVDFSYSDNERAMARDSVATARELCVETGFDVVGVNSNIGVPGTGSHELGGCRMGDDPCKSVLNAYNRLHDVRNIFVVDGAAFVSSGVQNPTLTICALSLRACKHMVEQMRNGEL